MVGHLTRLVNTLCFRSIAGSRGENRRRRKRGAVAGIKSSCRNSSWLFNIGDGGKFPLSVCGFWLFHFKIGEALRKTVVMV